MSANRLRPVSFAGRVRPSTSRLLRAALAASLGVVVMSGCSIVGDDAARVGDMTLSNSDFQDILEGYTEATLSGLLPSGNIDSETARIILLDWISTSALESTLVDYGVEVSETDLESANQSLESQLGFADAPENVRDFYIRATAVRVLAGSTFSPDAENLAEVYATGPQESGIACLRLILTDTRGELDAAIARIDAGESFADVATDVSTDPSAEIGGILRNDQTAAECFPYEEIVEGVVEQIGTAISQLRPNDVTEPVEIPDVGWVALTLRPLSEVTAEVKDIIEPVTASRLSQSALDNASVWVNPEYGRWDAETRQVVADQ